MKVLADIHHEELFESLRILFEDRLGWELYRPLGLNWWEQGYWKMGYWFDRVIQHSGATQMLCIGKDLPFRELKDGERLVGDSLYIVQGNKKYLRYINLSPGFIANGIYSVKSPVYPEKTYKGITLDAFKETPFDILVSTVPEHIEGFNKLIKEYHPKAKHIFQAGNPWSPPVDQVKNILTSTMATRSDQVNCVYYHQEFDLTKFSLATTQPFKQVSSMMHYLSDFDIFYDLEKVMYGSWKFKLYGAGCRDGIRGPNIEDIAKQHKDCAALWHVKKEGEGYGYNVHHSFAVGRPVVVRRSHFTGMTIDPLLIDGVTCIDLDQHSLAETCNLLDDCYIEYDKWRNNVYNRFKEIVNFDQEFEKIKEFLANLQ